MAHGFVAKAASFTFPLSTAISTKGDKQALRSLFDKAMLGTTLIGTFSALLLFLLGNELLTLWLGRDFAVKGTPILQILAIANGINSTTVIPFYFYNGTGYVRTNTLLGILSATTFLVMAILLVPEFGVIGVASAQLFSLPIVLTSLTVLTWTVLGDKRWFSGPIKTLPPLACFLVAGTMDRWIGALHPRYVLLSLHVLVLGLCTVLGIVLAIRIYGFGAQGAVSRFPITELLLASADKNTGQVP
jgi:O-antigen/teichoic acid export membrane protein